MEEEGECFGRFDGEELDIFQQINIENSCQISKFQHKSPRNGKEIERNLSLSQISLPSPVDAVAIYRVNSTSLQLPPPAINHRK